MNESCRPADLFKPLVDYLHRHFTCHYKRVNSKKPNDYTNMLQIRRKKSMMKFNFRSCDISWTKMVIAVLVLVSSINLSVSSHSARYSAPLNNSSEDDFKPMMVFPHHHFDTELIARQQFTKTGQYRIFEPVESDLRLNRKEFETTTQVVKSEENPTDIPKEINEDSKSSEDAFSDMDFSSELKSIEDSISSYLDELFVKKTIQKSGITVKINDSETNEIENSSSTENKLEKNMNRFVRSAVVNVSLPRAVETGRLFFFSGLKKILWPIFIGIQIFKSLIFALFLPSIIGSLGKIATQGSSSLAGFNRPSETVNDLNFKDNFEDDSKFMVMDDGSYAYNQPEASSNHFSTQLYDAATLNNNALSRFGYNNNDNKDLYLNTLGYEEKKNTHSNQDSSSMSQIYQSFKKLPSSALVLSNYDPFYSPLLSRLDGIFEQLGLKSKDENCREKLVCFMYADPQKYAPYSNLVSAQLSRELDELRKPTSENPEILRFFKYMKAAKDGQDGVKCEDNYSMCTDFKDLESPAMINTFNNINKLVEARKLLH